VAHVASNVSFSSDYDTVVRDAVESTLVALKASHATPSVKRFVLTSSVVAVTTPDSSRQKDLRVTEKDFNHKTIEIAKSLKDDDPTKGAYVYGASKTEGELAAWKFVKENKVSQAFCFLFIRIETHITDFCNVSLLSNSLPYNPLSVSERSSTLLLNLDQPQDGYQVSSLERTLQSSRSYLMVRHSFLSSLSYW